MAKSIKRRKKNYRLVRQVKRTIAALTMIMAIVIAAIPVENYGSMQAAAGDAPAPINMADEYGKDESGLFGSLLTDNKDKAYIGTPMPIQQIQPDGNDVKVVNAYMATPKSDSDKTTAMVSGRYGKKEEITVNGPEYYCEMFYEESLVNTLNTGVSGLKVELDNDANSVSLGGGTYATGPAGTDGNIPTATLSGIGDVYKISGTFKNTEKQSMPAVESKWGVTGSQNSTSWSMSGSLTLNWNDKEIAAYEQAAVDSAKKKANDYNAIVQKLETIQGKLGQTTPVLLSREEISLWNTYAGSTKISDAHDESNNFTLASKKPEDGLPKLYEYILKTNYKNGSIALADYSFIKGKDVDGKNVYLLQKPSEKGTTSAPFHDKAGYLAGGCVTITGVMGGAFNGGVDAATKDITSITLPDTADFDFIGKRAFYGTKITEITIPAGVTAIGAGAFEGCSLTNVSFDAADTKKVDIGDYAFYNCGALKTVEFGTFGTGKQYDLGKGSFAMPTVGNDNMTAFTFPDGNTAIDKGYVLANRSALTSVVFGSKLDGVIPNTTLRGCSGLQKAEFKSTMAKYDTYDNGLISDQLFCDVTTNNFIVIGPQKKSATPSDDGPQISTWTAYYGGEGPEKGKAVPYQYSDVDGNVHIEIGENKGTTIAQIDALTDSTAILTEYRENTAEGMPRISGKLEVKIPVGVGSNNNGGYRYNITKIAENCFGSKVRDNVYRIDIEDAGHFIEIGDNAFNGCGNLEWVFIGSSVKKIGAGAFAGCPKLENVEFSMTELIEYKDGKMSYQLNDEDYDAWGGEVLSIASDAFGTLSKTGPKQRLTFHGAIHKGYAPFEMAMGNDKNNPNMLGSGRQICYKMDEPLNMTVMRNRADGRATLIDYPHYQEIDKINSEYIKENHTDNPDYSITGEFEAKCVDSRKGMGSDVERSIVEAALNIELPRGIESISTHKIVERNGGSEKVGFFDADPDGKDSEYIKKKYVFKEGNINKTGKDDTVYVLEDIETPIRGSGSGRDITKLYSEDGYISDSKYKSDYALPADEKVSKGGLFSGYFNDDGLEVDSDTAKAYNLRAAGDSGLIGKRYNEHDYKEMYESGNDYITSVKMMTVEELPDYAFDNSENLLTATFGDSLVEMGKLPFRGCKNVYSVDFVSGEKKTKFMAQNMMIFEKNDDGETYTLKECLEGRGNGGRYGMQIISSEELPEGVTAIDDRAFANCDKLTGVDLSLTEITKLPEDCFKNSKNLMKLTLPKTIRRIETGALVGVSKLSDMDEYSSLTLIVPNGNCVISNDAIDGKAEVDIWGPMFMADGKTPSDLAGSVDNLKKSYPGKITSHDSETTYKVEFIDMKLRPISGYDNIEVDKGGSLVKGQIAPAPQVNGYDFVTWMCRVDGGVLSGRDIDDPVGNNAFTNITQNRTYYPFYEANPNTVVSDGVLHKVTFENADATYYSEDEKKIKTLKSGDSIYGGIPITFVASDRNRFESWSAQATDGSQKWDMSGENEYILYFTMRNTDVSVKATLKTDGSSGSGGSGGSGSGSGGSGSGGTGNSGSTGTDNKTKYKVTVNYGSGSGEYEAGATVNISAFAPESSSKIFSRWTTGTSGLGFANANSATTSFVMPASEVTVTANYKTRTADDEDDTTSSSSSRRPGTSSDTSTSTTTTVPNRENATTATNSTPGTVNNNAGTGQAGGTGNDNWNRIYITKNGVSNTDVASLAVDGSTDNFIVKISESAEATAAVEQALRNEYGSLEGLSYLPMDISLYDWTGQNKITDTTGLNITVTMPIPDVLIQYGGNARVAAADNGTLTQLRPRFTTIDGIACISFVPPHFSPYVIYVDTNNLVAGQMLDATPATGDPIHPKWFAALGMACISILLFVTSDGRRRKNYKTA